MPMFQLDNYRKEKDRLGVELQLGDRILYTASRNDVLSFATIMGFHKNANATYTKIYIQAWDPEIRARPITKKTYIFLFHNIIVINGREDYFKGMLPMDQYNVTLNGKPGQ